MSIVVELSREQLASPEIAGAAVALIDALAAHVGGRVEPAAPAVERVAPTPGVVRDTGAPRSFAEFEEALPERSQRFLRLLRERGTLRVSEVVELLGLPGPKAVGGITGAIARWAPQRGIALPYRPIKLRGERAWRWFGDTAGPRLSPVRAPAPAPEVARASAPAPEVVPVPERVSVPQPPEGDFDGLIAQLPGQSQRFMELLRERRRLTLDEAREALGLARASAVHGLLRPIRAMAPDFGLSAAFETATNADGDRVLLWPGTPLETTQKPKPEAPALTGGQPAETELREPRAEPVAPGLLRRRRAVSG